MASKRMQKELDKEQSTMTPEYILQGPRSVSFDLGGVERDMFAAIDFLRREMTKLRIDRASSCITLY
jgi:hypothetical protein